MSSAGQSKSRMLLATQWAILLFGNTFGGEPAQAMVLETGVVPGVGCEAKAPGVKVGRVERRSDEETSSNFLVSWQVDARGLSVEYPEPGESFLVVRCLPQGKWVTVGQGVVSGVAGVYTEGMVSAPKESDAGFGKSSAAAVQSGNLYWRPMVGDAVWTVRKTVVQHLQISPRIALSFDELFDRSAGDAYSWEISEIGVERLLQEAKKFKGLSGRFSVECYLDRPGEQRLLVEESQMRANLIAGFLSRKLEISESRIVPSGFGSVELSSAMKPQARATRKDISNRIVLRILPD